MGFAYLRSLGQIFPMLPDHEVIAHTAEDVQIIKDSDLPTCPMCFTSQTLGFSDMKAFRSWLNCILPLSSFFLSIYAAAVGSVLNLPTISSFESTVFSPSNISHLGEIDRTKFQIRIRYGPDALPATSVLLLAVDVMVRFALANYATPIGRELFVLDIPQYSDVVFIISPWDNAPTASMPVVYALLGLYDVLLKMLSDPTTRFKSVDSTFAYKGVDVGWLRIRYRPRRPNPPSDSNVSSSTDPTLPTSSQTAHSLDNSVRNPTKPVNVTALPNPAWLDPRLHVTTIQGLETLNMYEIFFVVLTFLQAVASNPRTKRVPDFDMEINQPPITLAGEPVLLAFRNQGNPPRTAENPPYFQLEWLIKGLAKLPQYMLESRDLNNVLSMVFSVDGVDVGWGYMLRKHPTGVRASGGASANVSTA